MPPTKHVIESMDSQPIPLPGMKYNREINESAECLKERLDQNVPWFILLVQCRMIRKLRKSSLKPSSSFQTGFRTKGITMFLVMYFDTHRK
jgi:hypothetical protein